MKVGFEKIKELVQGAERVVENNGEISFFRFTEAEDKLYSLSELYPRTHLTAGIKFHFKTDAKYLSVSIRAENLIGAGIFSLDIFVNRKFCDCIRNYADNLPETGYIGEDKNYPLGEFSKEMALPEGEKEIEMYFPWSIKCILLSLELEDASYVDAIRRDKKLLVYGDSIVQGTAAQNPSRVHTVRLAELLEAELISKAIGSEVYFPELAGIKSERYSPDYIYVGYGVNDWYTLEYEDAEDRCRRFWKAICENYPNAGKICVSPIWYRDHNIERPFGSISGAEEMQMKVTSEYPDITFVRGWELVPAEDKYLVDGVHPNNEGFDFFYRNLKSKLGI